MPKTVTPLTDTKVKSAKPLEREYKLFDGKGLFLLVTPVVKGGKSHGKLWRFRYQFDGKDKTLAIGSYPEVSLAEARERREIARKQVAAKIDPAAQRKAEKAERDTARANTFEKLAREWISKQETVLGEHTRKTILTRLENVVFPKIGSTSLAELSPRTILEDVLRPIEGREAIELAHRVRGIISQVLRYGVACSVCERDLTVDLRGALKPAQRKHHAALEDANGTTDQAKVGKLLRVLDDYDGNLIIKCAIRLHPFVATRPGELRHMEWSEIDFDTATWAIPAGKMKMKNPHIVPLSPQAVAIIKELEPFTGGGKYVFPCVRSTARPISDNSMNAALRRSGYTREEMVSHGWRAIFRTLADEVLKERVEHIEAQLAHKVSDTLGRAYNRTSFLKERRDMMNRWGSYLEGLKAGGQVIPITRKVGA